jgi:U3 small nucleolar RNA-associated protein 5
VELNSVAGRVGVGSGHEDELAQDIDGNLEVDLAELSLGQRLTALSGADEKPSDATSDDDQEQSLRGKQKSTRKAAPNLVPANSLTRTLIQALHSSDTRLLETCLAHSDSTIIRNTVRKLPPQLVVPLLTACVERLGQGARSASMKGGGGASSQKGTTLVAWIKVVLVVHHGHLITVRFI